MGANYYRMSVRFRKQETVRKLHALRREVSKKAEKKISVSRLVEQIVEQFIDKERIDPQEEEKS